MMDAGRHPRIKLHNLSEVVGLSGREGDFRAQVRTAPRYVDPDLCVACGLCAVSCPATKPNPYDLGMKTAKAIDRPFPQAVPATYTLDRETCLNDQIIYCDRCLRACEPNAIDFDAQATEQEIAVGSVIVATGFDELDPRELLPLGYGKAPNVLTGLEFERLLCATGPTRGRVLRPTDLEVPKRVVFVQCVGSRGEGGRSWCSRYCCLNAVKAANLAHEHEPDIEECTLLYTDMRATGRGFDDFVKRTLDRDDVTTLRGRPAKIQEDEATRDLTIWVEDFGSGRPQQVTAQMVVLSTAAVPARGSARLAKILGIERSENGYIERPEPECRPAATTRPGVYVAGSAGSPSIIPECVAQGGAAAMLASAHVLDHRDTSDAAPAAEPRDITGPPRVGVFVCHCGANISGVVDVKALAADAAKLPHVVYTIDESFACADVAQRAIEAAIAENDLNRVVIAACTPRTHEPVFRDVLGRSGLNPFLLEMVNIRDQCTWVHAHAPDEAHARAGDQIRMGVARAAQLEPLTPIGVEVTRRALVVGGGPAGLRAAIDLDTHGYEVVLVERRAQLGGLLTEPGLHRLYGTEQPAAALRDTLVQQIERSGVEVRTGTELTAVGGYVGNFTVAMTPVDGGDTQHEEIGTIVLATGARPYEPKGQFGYGEKRNVVTSVELEKHLRDPQDDLFGEKGQVPTSAVFVQCVGSRCDCEGCNPGCSRFCCLTTLRQALDLAERGVRVTVFNRDIRATSPGGEELYRRARGAGVIFIRIVEGTTPEVLGSKTKANSVVGTDVVMNRPVAAPADLVVLAVGLVPDTEVVGRLREILKVPVGPDGFFLERHPELGPVETVVDGVLVCGTAVGAKGLNDALAEASAAAGKASQLLARDSLTLEPTVASVDPWLCRGCGVCVDMCDFNAPSLVEGELGLKVAQVNEASCQGCGTCVA